MGIKKKVMKEVKGLEALLEREIREHYPPLANERFFRGLERLALFMERLLAWRGRVNLVGKGSYEEIFHHLVVDSLFMVKFFESIFLEGEGLVFWDIGAGCGIPGIPFRIYYTGGQYIMLEPRKKRFVFTNLMLNSLSLPGTCILNISMEGFVSPIRPQVVLARAVWPWREFLERVFPVLEKGGMALIFSNSACEESYYKGFYLVKESSYRIKGGWRYFWLFEKNAPS